jgi:acyl carrier protein phosphodiesterase
MSNHLHLVVHVDVEAAQRWSDDEIAQRWCQLFPCREKDNEQRVQKLLKNPSRLALLQQRLCSLSWFMRYINEPIARAALV